MELNRLYRFDTFVVGASNQMAAEAARTVAESPGTAYNPLFLFSPTGLGKTHLLTAIGHHARQVAGSIAVEYLTLEEFVEAFHAAVAAGQSDAFRKRFSGLDVLLIDDVQFLTHRREMQAELLRLMGELQGAGKQVVLTSDEPPAAIENLDERLISGFAGGLVVDILRPEFATRLAILERRARDRGAQFSAGVLEAAAGPDVANVRELLGLLNRLVAFQAVSDEPLKAESVAALLGLAAASPAGAAGSAPAAAAPAAAVDEFSGFLSDVTSVVTQQVEAWRRRIGEAILRWEGEGYRTARLDELLKRDTPAGAEAAVRKFEADVERLRALETEIAALDSGAAGDAVFRNPDRVADAEALVQRAREGLAPLPGPSLLWTFEEYVSGEVNKVALRAARAVAESPGTRYNPLVLVGPAGVGKTHLLHAIGNALAGRAGAAVACMSARDFADELAQAVDGRRIESWRTRMRRATALLLDDVHLVRGLPEAQEELFHLVNHLEAAQRQLVFTVTTLPSEVGGFDERLSARLDEGLLATVAPPDRELRLAIVRRQLEARVGNADPDLVEYLAARPAESTRVVIAFVQRVLSAAEGQGAPPSASLAREIFEGAAPRLRRPTPGLRTSGLIVSPTAAVRSREKLVWFWPDSKDRIVEDLD
ncbi:MAG: ATP-binding protein [Gemmatimonadetes bacterium]|nr:ATP-binding protein [Gemmatimonadota bacterium]